MIFKKPLQIDEYLESFGNKDFTYDVVDAEGIIIATTWYKEVANKVKETLENE